MGGQGSGRYGRRPIAERSQPLHIRHWYTAIRRALQRGPSSEVVAGTVHCLSGDQETHVFRCVLCNDDGALALQLFLDDPDPRLVYILYLTSTAQRLGGVRWWWVCPDCEQRAAVLYSPRGIYWCCRQCANHITYQSSNASDKRIAYDRIEALVVGAQRPALPEGMGARAMARWLDASDRSLFLLMKAYDRVRRRDERDYRHWQKAQRKGMLGRPRKRR